MCGMADDYDFRPKTAGGLPMHLPAQADEALAEAYRALMSFKGALDQMQEIPSDLQPYYRQIMKAADAVVGARKESYQLREMVKRLARR